MEENINKNEDITICIDEEERNHTEEEEETRGVDIVEMVAADPDLTFQRSRLELTERTPRVRSFPDLVDINLLFSDETFHEADVFTNLSNESECNNISNIANDFDDDMDDKMSDGTGDDSQPFDCIKFLLFLRAVNMQKKKAATSKNTNSTENEEAIITNKTDSEEISKNKNNTNYKKDETTKTRLKFADVAKIQKNINNWTKKTRKLYMANVDTEDWGIELTDMAGDSNNTCSEETYTNFDRLKTMDMWQQLSHYIKLKVRTTTIEVQS